MGLVECSARDASGEEQEFGADPPPSSRAIQHPAGRRLVRLRLGSARRRSMECALRRMARSLDSLIAGAAVMNKTNPHVMDPAVVLGKGHDRRGRSLSEFLLSLLSLSPLARHCSLMTLWG
jgi:hypothetical protein